MVKDKLIAALDFHTKEDALALVEKLGDNVVFYKVGMELFYAVGDSIIRDLKERNKKIFLDLKLHDIPNTVAQGLCSLLRQGADIMTIHSQGGYTMMKTAVDTVRAEAKRLNVPAPKIIAITVLTSINEDDWQGLGQITPIKEQVVRLAKLAKQAGLDGVVASPKEAKAIREACGADFMIVTPGVRPAGASLDDQSRVATPAKALQDGATHLVIGRPIRAAKDPVVAAKNILIEMENA